MKKFCGNCEAMHEVNEKTELREYEIKKTKVAAEITILTCNHCGEEIYDKETEIKNDILLFDAYKLKNNLLTSKEIISIREKYGLSQATFSKILGFGLKTITRYENGAIQDSTHDNLLRLVGSDFNFFSLWYLNKNNLTQVENKKISSRFHIMEAPSIEYDYKEPCNVVFNQTNGLRNGEITYGGC